MHGGSVGCEITGRRTLGRGGGAFTIPILSMWKNRGGGGGGRINDGGRSGGTLRYNRSLHR